MASSASEIGSDITSRIETPESIPPVKEYQVSDLSDDESELEVLSEEEEGYQGDTDNLEFAQEEVQNSSSYPSLNPDHQLDEVLNRTKKIFANKKTRFISEAKRAMRIKQSPVILSSKMAIESNENISTDVVPGLAYTDLHTGRSKKDKYSNDISLELSSSSSSSLADFSNDKKNEMAGIEDDLFTEKGDVTKILPNNIENVGMEKINTTAGKKRKRPFVDENDGTKSKSKKKQKSRHLRKNIKDIRKSESLQNEAKEAKAEEQERLKRLQDAQAAQKRLLQEVLSRQACANWQPKDNAANCQNDQYSKNQVESVSLTPSKDDVINLTSSSGEENSKFKDAFPKNDILRKESAFRVKEVLDINSREECKETKPSFKEESDLFYKKTPVQFEKPKKETTIEHSSSDDCKIVEYDDVLEGSDEEDPDNSGLHVDDRVNVPQYFGDSNIEKVLVNVAHPSDEPDIFLPPQIQRIIKPHQIGGIRFLYDNLVENQRRFNSSQGFGCILAHAMGLGKTLQVISFCHAFLNNTSAKRILCIVPINTIQNWLAEFNKWLPSDEIGEHDPSKLCTRKFSVFLLNDTLKNLEQRSKVIYKWKDEGGVLLMGYELFRMLATKKQRKKRKKKADSHVCIDLEEEDLEKMNLEEIQKALVKPGPDLVVCDEGHRIKNAHASTSQALKNIATKRRLVLTGYPLQNNLMEYWCMVDFVRPNYLGNKVEFANMFERPIQNGLCVDSTAKDKRVMMHRSHVLYHELKGFVQRRSHAVLKETLPKKTEHVILIKMTPIQKQLYSTFMNQMVLNSFVTANPLKAFAVCCKIWNHPDVLYNFLRKKETSSLFDLDIEPEELGVSASGIGENLDSPKKKINLDENSSDPTLKRQSNQVQEKELLTNELINHGPGFNPFGLSTSSSGKKLVGGTGDEIDYDWAEGLFEGYTSGQLENSAKLKMFLLLLDETIKSGERMLLFSQSLLTLNLIEEFLQKRRIPNSDSTWIPGAHYFRLDGSTPAMERERLINSFNAAAPQSLKSSSLQSPTSEVRCIPMLFLISTRAGSLGINLTGASRVVIFDASWNPCHDSQAVCRIYRYGQTQRCHIYRLVTDGSLERKIYDRQINKQGMSNRIVDEMNPDAYLHSKDINSLLCLEEDEPRGNICKQSGKSLKVDPEVFDDIDPVLANVLREAKEDTTAQPFAHESLLIDRKEKKLSKAERRMAERSYKIERGARISYKRTSYADYYPQSSTSQSALSQTNPPGKYAGSSPSINQVSNMNLNFKRNSYASFYSDQSPAVPQEAPSSLLKSTNSKISQLYQGFRSPDEHATAVHPVWPAKPIAQTTFGSIGNGTNEHKIPIQQQLPLNFNNAKRDMASKGTQRLQNQGIFLIFIRIMGRRIVR